MMAAAAVLGADHMANTSSGSTLAAATSMELCLEAVWCNRECLLRHDCSGSYVKCEHHTCGQMSRIGSARKLRDK